VAVQGLPPLPPVMVGLTLVYIGRSIKVGVVALIIYAIGRIWIDLPFQFGTVWSIDNDVPAGLARVYPIFIWVVAITLLTGLVMRAKRIPRDAPPRFIFLTGGWISINAGFFEEIIWRWLLLLSAPVILTVLNWVTFGFVHWLYGQVLIPVANFATIGILEPQLLTANWLLGATVISVNGHFRQSHERNGLLAYVNSWFVGMVMFYLMFNYGIWSAIVAHTVYDVLAFTTAAIVATGLRPAEAELYRPTQ
jgi:hypothetical protein